MITARTIIEDSIDYIETKYPGLIRFVPDEYVLKSLELHVQTKKFSTPLYLYGINFLLAFMEYCVEIEEYEICSAILNAINDHNSLIGDKLPTKLDNA